MAAATKKRKLHPNRHDELEKCMERFNIEFKLMWGWADQDTYRMEKEIFTEWKCAMRKKARAGKVLIDLENKLIRLTGTGAVDGMKICEFGPEVEVVIL